MIKVNHDVKGYEQCSFCNDGTSAIAAVSIATSKTSEHTLKMCDVHLQQFRNQSATSGNYFDSKKENVDAIVCPYCEHVHGNYDDFIEVGDMAGEFKMDCQGECGNEFDVDFYSTFHFQTKKIIDKRG